MKEKLQHILQRGEYLFNTSTKTILVLNGTVISHENLGIIVNATTNETLYNPFCEGFGGNILPGGKELVLDRNIPTTMNDGDNLIIMIQDNLDYIGTHKNEKRVQETNSNLLKEILRELKINNLHLTTITGSSFTDGDINNN